ncbi:type III secretion inner membrane ring lipoprotein SctJ [Herbaspirillum sp. RTI4]|uniref:type III secretion system inner membrane ring lipoprotein SctJ n=1 Tax=Herbaspirillum sp. RTI4 TaxID=3048640 RepID=UPI002AB3742C|nr:type III secretion inner membrane ring lipoprotein SctJ [Herbaspirillum sp. RTI4]MDY7578353.1 type III secretion inner membrane ring lipoprotein SctJ [Herbaspirillum sp. RTI4]MEA9981154.1 type III secretion inner membrane ring lipoprotein SctJ [Herbaspirillum sp. RTI4]
MRIYSSLSIALFAIILTGCDKELLEGLDQRQANEVLAALQRSNISADKKNNGKKGYSVKVNGEDMATAVDLLKINELPSPPRTQIADMFPKDTLVTSPRGEKARLYSAIEQRLEQSLATMDGVSSARVHVSYDIDGDGGKKSGPIHVSALITYNKDLDEQQLINTSKRFLKNSFTQIDYDNISIVPTRRAVLQHTTNVSAKSGWRDSQVFIAFGVFILFSISIGFLLFVFFRSRNKSLSSFPSAPNERALSVVDRAL